LRGLRPTSDRVREALFARLGALDGASVLDLCAGTGALGIEALSRGAARTVFVERSVGCAALVRANLADLGLSARGRVLRGDARSMLRRLARAGERFDLILFDPPYGSAETTRVLEAVVEAGILAAGATVVVETSRRDGEVAAPGLDLVDRRGYGDTTITRLAPAGGAGLREGAEEAMTQPNRVPRVGLFAASFDPVTNGHLDLVRRARRVFDELVLALGTNVSKQGTFTVEERLDLLREVVGDDAGIRVTSFDGLVVEYAREIGATALVRGLRAMSDFEYEFEMALMNKHLYPELETLFMMTNPKFFYVSSSRLKELIRFGGNIEDFVPPIVAKKLREKLTSS
jgi:pantetheine-phosphate adenylyltransferase